MFGPLKKLSSCWLPRWEDCSYIYVVPCILILATQKLCCNVDLYTHCFVKVGLSIVICRNLHYSTLFEQPKEFLVDASTWPTLSKLSQTRILESIASDQIPVWCTSNSETRSAKLKLKTRPFPGISLHLMGLNLKKRKKKLCNQAVKTCLPRNDKQYVGTSTGIEVTPL